MIFVRETGTIVHAADSGVALGVNVLSVGPATINDFDYNFSQEVTDSDTIKDVNNNLSENLPTDTGSVKGATSDNGTTSLSQTATGKNITQNSNSNATVVKTESEDSQGEVLGVRTENSSSWFRRAINKCGNFFKNILKI